MWEIWAKILLQKALNSGPKSNKLPNLVTLIMKYRLIGAGLLTR